MISRAVLILYSVFSEFCFLRGAGALPLLAQNFQKVDYERITDFCKNTGLPCMVD